MISGWGWLLFAFSGVWIDSETGPSCEGADEVNDVSLRRDSDWGPLALSPVGEDAADRAVPSGHVLTPAVFRRGPLPSDEREKAHLDLSRL